MAAAMRRFIVFAVLAALLILGGCGRASELRALLDEVNDTLLSIAVLKKAR